MQPGRSVHDWQSLVVELRKKLAEQLIQLVELRQFWQPKMTELQDWHLLLVLTK